MANNSYDQYCFIFIGLLIHRVIGLLVYWLPFREPFPGTLSGNIGDVPEHRSEHLETLSGTLAFWVERKGFRKGFRLTQNERVSGKG